MKYIKIILVGLLMISFISCATNDDREDCYNCDANLAVPVAIQYCDNGNGTMDVTTNGLTKEVDLLGQSFEDFIAGAQLVTNCSKN